MTIKYVEPSDQDFWLRTDKHANAKRFMDKVTARTGYVMWDHELPIGLLHYSVLWDNLPFLNLLFVLDEHRNKGCGTEAMLQWEQDMRAQGYKMLLLSTQVDESAQHFYRKLGYVDCGGLMLDHTPFAQPMELFLRKVL